MQPVPIPVTLDDSITLVLDKDDIEAMNKELEELSESESENGIDLVENAKRQRLDPESNYSNRSISNVSEGSQELSEDWLESVLDE